MFIRWTIAMRLLTVVLAATTAIGGCRPAGVPDTDRRGPLRVVVSIAPLKGLVEALVPPGTVVDLLIPPGASEHGYEIPPGRLAAVATADLVVFVGLGLEPQVDALLGQRPNPNRRVVRFDRVAGVEADSDDHRHEHEHDETCDHGHAADPHLWLDPVLVEQLVEALAREVDALDTATPRERRAARAQELRAKVRGVHDAYGRSLGPLAGRTIVVGHDAWGRLAARYGLKTVALKGLTAAEPTPGDLRRAIESIGGDATTTVFVEPQLSPAAAERIARATGARVETLDPLGSGDWFAMMDANLAALVRAFEPAR
ncbi:MAG: zinc ABC transporter substrate-binding protein [Phycisphaerae bacterium]|nr:zinc ABC transporter substrate-binding protein [Phycisphaerae bacterium]